MTGFPRPGRLTRRAGLALLGAAISILLGGGPAYAQFGLSSGGGPKTDKNAPIVFQADEVEYDDQLAMTVAKGHVEISQNGLTAWVTQVQTQSTAPGIFTPDGVYGVVQHGSDYSLVTRDSPAKPGEHASRRATATVIQRMDSGIIRRGGVS